MIDEKVLGHARFKDGKLIMPSKQKNTTFRNNNNNYKQKFSRNNTRFYPSYQQKQIPSLPTICLILVPYKTNIKNNSKNLKLLPRKELLKNR